MLTAIQETSTEQNNPISIFIYYSDLSHYTLSLLRVGGMVDGSVNSIWSVISPCTHKWGQCNQQHLTRVIQGSLQNQRQQSVNVVHLTEMKSKKGHTASAMTEPQVSVSLFHTLTAHSGVTYVTMKWVEHMCWRDVVGVSCLKAWLESDTH